MIKKFFLPRKLEKNQIQNMQAEEKVVKRRVVKR